MTIYIHPKFPRVNEILSWKSVERELNDDDSAALQNAEKVLALVILSEAKNLSSIASVAAISQYIEARDRVPQNRS